MLGEFLKEALYAELKRRERESRKAGKSEEYGSKEPA